MNRNQRRVLIAASAAIILMLAFPPFHLICKDAVIRNVGYGWIFNPPRGGAANVNVPMHLMQWLGVLLVGGIVFVLCKDSRKGFNSGFFESQDRAITGDCQDDDYLILFPICKYPFNLSNCS